MTRIICAEDCGNAPKKLLIKKLLTALARDDSASVLKYLSDDVVWQRVGKTPLQGKQAVAAELHKMKRELKSTMIIENILTHGAGGAANGRMLLENGKSIGFAYVYRFQGATGALIRNVTEYLIRI